MTLPQFERLVERLAGRIPEPLLRGLHGGIQVVARSHRRPGDPPGVLILGEYIQEPHIGPLIALYYGSFRRMFGGLPAAAFEQEVWETLRHEVRHHVEAMAGVGDLDDEDRRQMAEFWREAEADGEAEGERAEEPGEP